MEEVECDGELSDADSSMSLTLSGGGRRTVTNINVSSAGVERGEIWATDYMFLTMFDKLAPAQSSLMNLPENAN